MGHGIIQLDSCFLFMKTVETPKRREHYPFVNDKTRSKPEALCLVRGLALPAPTWQ